MLCVSFRASASGDALTVENNVVLCATQLRAMAGFLVDLSEGDHRDLLSLAADDAGFAEELHALLTDAQVLDIPEAVLALIARSPLRPYNAVHHIVPFLSKGQRLVLTRALAAVIRNGKVVTAESFKAALRDWFFTNLLSSMESHRPALIPQAPEEEAAACALDAPAPTREDISWLEPLLRDALDRRAIEKFLVAVSCTSPCTKKLIWKELRNLAFHHSSLHSKKVGEGVHQINPGVNARILYGVRDGRPRLISARLNIKAGRTHSNCRQCTWIHEGVATWRTFMHPNKKPPVLSQPRVLQKS
jgi:hypothetical protein